MQIGIKTLVVAVVGAVAFSNGLHNALSHPDLGWELTWFSLFSGTLFLGVAAGDVIHSVRRGIKKREASNGSAQRVHQGNQMINFGPAAEAVSLNPIQTLKDEPDFVIDFLVLAAGEAVADGVKTRAKEVALALVKAKGNVNILNLVEEFDQVPELKEFSAKLREGHKMGSQTHAI